MIGTFLITTVNQKVLSLLAKFSDQEFFERQVARDLGIGYGSANHSLNQLFRAGAVGRKQKGKMYFYSIDASNSTVIEFKKLVNLWLLEPLVEDLRPIANKIILYGSAADGTDTSRSDIDLFIVANSNQKVSTIISEFKFSRGFEIIRIQATIMNPVEMLQAGREQQEYLDQVERGVILWEKLAGEPRFREMS